MNKLPILLAHAQNVFLALFVLAAAANLLGLAAVVSGLRRGRRDRPKAGLVAGSVATLTGLAFCAIHRFRPPYLDPLMLALIGPLILGPLGLFLAVRRKSAPTP